MRGLLIGTDNAGVLFQQVGRKWKLLRTFLIAHSVNHYAVDEHSGILYSATLTDGVYISKNIGRKWTRSYQGMPIRKVWTLTLNPENPRVILAGTHYGHLFRSENGGISWNDVEGLHQAPGRKEWGIDWGFGTTGHCLHTVLFDPLKNGRIYIVSSGGGAYRSDDDGASWTRIRKGTLSSCPTAKNDPHHLKEVHACTHRIAMAPLKKQKTLLFQQNHCGVYRSDDSGESWQDISEGLPSRHGFPIAVTIASHPTIFVIPAYQGKCKHHNSCIQGPLEVWRSSDTGITWEKASKGLPSHIHTCVLRHALTSSDDGTLFFGTTTGQLYTSDDGGDSWNLLHSRIGRIQGITTFTL